MKDNEVFSRVFFFFGDNYQSISFVIWKTDMQKSCKLFYFHLNCIEATYT